MSERRIDPDQNPHGELASAAIAIAFALRVRGREDDQAAAALLARLGERARMHLAGSVQRDLLASLDGEDARPLALFDAAMG